MSVDYDKHLNIVQVDGVTERDPLDTTMLDFRINGDPVIRRVQGDEILHDDLIAHRFYRNSRVWWVVMLVNDIVNPFSDLEVGMELSLPSGSDVWNVVHGSLNR